MRDMGIQGNMMRLIEKIYKETKNKIATGNEEGENECFWTGKGVKQGYPVSPTLFSIYINDMERKWKRKNIGETVVGNQKIFCVKIADVAIVADHEEGLREILAELEIYCDKNDLEVNTEKSKIIKFRKGGKRGKKSKSVFSKEENWRK